MQYWIMALFLAVIVAIPLLWFAVGRKTYGTGDYRQP